MEFDSRIKIFRIFTHNDEIDILISRTHTDVRFAGPQAGIKVELFAQRDIHGAESGSDRRGDR